KTIHNWADRGKIRSWRTEGRHLRFRRLDVVDFLRQYEFALPDGLRESRPRVVAIDGDAGGLEATQRALGRRFGVIGCDQVVARRVAMAGLEPDVAILGEVAPLGAAAIATRLREVPETRHVRVVTLGASPAAGLPWAPRGEAAKLRHLMERLTGLE